MSASSFKDQRTRIAVATIRDQVEYSVRNNLREILRLARQAGRKGCDLFATEEVALTLFAGKGAAVRVGGPETRAVGRVAREFGMYVCLGTVLREKDGTLRNSQVLIDRRGRVAGVYHKMQLTNGEIRGGIMPGDIPTVFDTDFGRLGVVICYDSQFGEIARMMAVAGADLILFPHVGGAVRGDFTGRAIAFENTIWSATVGRGNCCVCDCRGYTVAETRKAGDLLIVDCSLGRSIMSTNPSVGAVRWRWHQGLERRPETYQPILGPPVTVESETWPLYLDNPLAAGAGTLDFALVNRSAVRQRGQVKLELPAPTYLLSDEYIDWFVDQQFGGDWGTRPGVMRFDLKPGERRAFRARFHVPAEDAGYHFARLSGRTGAGDPIFWERQLLYPGPLPELTVSRVAEASRLCRATGSCCLAKSGAAPLPLLRQCMGAPARSRADVRLAWDGEALLVRAVCRRYGPWSDDASSAADELSLVLNPDDDKIYWLRLNREGRQNTQRREKGAPVAKPAPPWEAKVTRRAVDWTAEIRIPLAGLGFVPRAGDRWRFNAQRSAVLPESVNRARSMSRIISGHAPVSAALHRRGVEGACWSVPYGRVDNPERLGWITFG